MLLTWHQTADQSDLSNNVQREISETGLYQPTDSPLFENLQLSRTQTSSPRAIHNSYLPTIRHSERSHLDYTSHLHTDCRIGRQTKHQILSQYITYNTRSHGP